MFLAVNFAGARKLLSTNSCFEHLLCACPSSGCGGERQPGPLGAMGGALVLAAGGGGGRVLYPFTGSRKWRPFGKNSALKKEGIFCSYVVLTKQGSW